MLYFCKQWLGWRRPESPVPDLISRILDTFSRFTPNSALDILLVTVLFYGVLMLVRGTRADQVLRGVILLFIFFALAAAAFHLTVVDWLLHNSPLVLLVALPIIFQPELRRALEQVGRTSALVSHPLATLGSPLQPSAVEELVDGVHRLAERRSGALIVIEGTTGLEDFVRSGVRVDGDVSSDLMVTIFFANSPLHDGAVIVRGDRILAAGVLLPLSDAPSASGYGTRHRAALGVSEQTDAACIVVSEETGTISVARAGHLSTNMSLERLTRYLEAFYRSHAQTIEPRLAATGGG
jgi:diadenylate cyclase